MKQSIQELTTAEAMNLLYKIGDAEAADELKNTISHHPEIENLPMEKIGYEIDLPKAKWRTTEHSFGYIKGTGDNYLDIDFAGNIKADKSLKGKRINIRLGSFYTMNYPGGSIHDVLIDYTCKHVDIKGKSQSIQFQQKFASKEGEGAGIIGSFVFSDLLVPKDGLEFEVQTINISNRSDENALKVLESEPIKDGLKLLDASFATLAPITKMVQGITDLVLKSSRNKKVQQICMGFDFNKHAVETAKLRIGTYVAVQALRSQINWVQWVYDQRQGLIVLRNDPGVRLPYNHLTFYLQNRNKAKKTLSAFNNSSISLNLQLNFLIK